MELLALRIEEWLPVALLVLCRVGGFLATAPVIGSRVVPMRVRAGLAVLLTWVLVPLAAPAAAPAAMGALMAAAAIEAALGFAMGFALQLIFAALVYGGQALGLSMGLGFASMVDPQNGVQVPVVSQFYVLTGTLLFLALGGHLLLVLLLAESLRAVPPGAAALGPDAVERLVAWGAALFAHGLLVVLPAVTAILVVNLAFGVVTRAAPQLNIFAVGFPVTLLVGFVVMGVTITQLLPRFEALLLEAADLVRALTGGG